MGKDSAIPWCDHMWNPWWGCSKIPNRRECDNCYANGFAKRVGANVWGPRATRRIASPKIWTDPYTWDRAAAEKGVRASVFCMSMGDLFEDLRDLDEPRERAWEVMRETPHLTWLLLTKRMDNVPAMFPPDLSAVRSRMLIGATIGTQAAVDDYSEWRPDFISVEPLLEPIDLRPWLDRRRPPSVIIGAESDGPRPGRPCQIEWVRAVAEQCDEYDAKCYIKQLHIDGRLSKDPSEWPEDLRAHRQLAWEVGRSTTSS
jgi:protein gp37